MATSGACCSSIAPERGDNRLEAIVKTQRFGRTLKRFGFVFGGFVVLEN